MTFDQFITKWNGRGIDFDGAYGDQCMDLMHQYCVEVLGITDGRVLAAPAAKDVWLTSVYGKEKFEAITNTPTGVPQKGDIILWGTGIGPYGHVAVFIEGDTNKFKSFDQNFPTGSKCKITDHNYTGVLGWLRFKGTPAQAGDTVTLSGTKFAELVDKATKYDAFVAAGYDTIDKVRAEIKSKQDTIDNLNQQINDRNNDIIQANGKISTLESQVSDLTTRVESLTNQAVLVPDLTKQVNHLEDQVKNYQEAEKSWNRARGQYEKQIKDLQDGAIKAAIIEILKKLHVI